MMWMHHSVVSPIIALSSRRSYICTFFKSAMTILYIVCSNQGTMWLTKYFYHEPLMLQSYPMTQFTCIYYHRTKSAIG